MPDTVHMLITTMKASHSQSCTNSLKKQELKFQTSEDCQGCNQLTAELLLYLFCTITYVTKKILESLFWHGAMETNK